MIGISESARNQSAKKKLPKKPQLTLTWLRCPLAEFAIALTVLVDEGECGGRFGLEPLLRLRRRRHRRALPRLGELGHEVRAEYGRVLRRKVVSETKRKRAREKERERERKRKKQDHKRIHCIKVEQFENCIIKYSKLRQNSRHGERPTHSVGSPLHARHAEPTCVKACRRSGRRAAGLAPGGRRTAPDQHPPKPAQRPRAATEPEARPAGSEGRAPSTPTCARFSWRRQWC